MPPLLLSWAFPAAARMGWLTTTVPNPTTCNGSGLAYLFRGNGTLFTPGFGRLTDQLRRQYLWAEDLTCNGINWAYRHLIKTPVNGPIILIGHSRGGRRLLKLATFLEQAGITVDLLFCIDVAFPPPVPANVRRAVHLYRSRWRLYPARPLVACPDSSSEIENIDLDQQDAPFPGTWLNHFNITGNEPLHQWIGNAVKQLQQRRDLQPAI